MGDSSHGIYFHEYIESLREHHPELLHDTEAGTAQLKAGDIRSFVREVERLSSASTRTDRFQRPLARKPGSTMAWALSSMNPRLAPRLAYKGLWIGKTPFDLVLYSNLMWELQPRTIVEFGALQGGSGLWFANQLDALCGHGEVHSFERLIECVSTRAAHPRLRFHHADLEDLDTLDQGLLARLPHPWLVIDDAHANVLELFKLMNGFLQADDYFIIEDLPAEKPIGFVHHLLQMVEEAGYLVDSHYADAFGSNLTCSPNAWLRKSPST